MSKHLIPREHGAYAELGFPLVAGLVLGRPGLAGWLFVLAAILLFLANESVVVLVGARGKRAREESGPAAKRTLALLAVLGVAAGLAALALADNRTRLLCLVPAVFALGLVPVVLSKNLKTLPGEMVAAAAFSAMYLPVAAAGGVQGPLLWGPPLVWFAGTVVATFAVHAIKARVTRQMPWVILAADAIALVALLGAITVALLWPDVRLLALAACIPLAATAVINFLALSPKKLKAVGWAVVAANTAALGVMAAA